MPISACKRGAQLAHRAYAGFTLLELILVLSIIGMASILVVPNVGNLDSRSFSAEIRQATSLLNYARRIAVVRGQPSTATFTVETSAQNSGEARAARSSVGEWESAGTAVSFRNSTDQEVVVEDSIEITFFPEGGSTGGTLRFVREEQEVMIHVDPFTGRISTESNDDQD